MKETFFSKIVKLRHKLLSATDNKDIQKIMWRINDLDNLIYEYRTELKDF